MADKTIEELKLMRAELAERRRTEVAWIAGAYQHDLFEKIGKLQLAIDAIDAVIAEGESGTHSRNVRSVGADGWPTEDK
jgi:hypothetical protein